MRYGELRAALPGVATNLLAERLRTLEAAGVVERRVAERAGIVYALTPWGEELRDAVSALIRWSTPLMVIGRQDDAFDASWLALSLGALLAGRTSAAPAEAALLVEGRTIMVRLDRDGPHVGDGGDGGDGTVLGLDPGTALGLAAGAVAVDDAIAAGSLAGDPAALHVIFGRP